MGEKSQHSVIGQFTGKFFKGLAIIAGVLAAIILVAYFILHLYLDSYLKSRLEKEVQQASNGLYQLDIGSLHISLIDFSVVSKNITLTTDSAKYLSIQKESGKTPAYYQLSARRFYISDLDIWPLLWGEEVHIPKVILSGPDIYAVTHPDSSQQKQKKPFLLNIHQKLEKYVSWLSIDTVRVEQGSLRYIVQSDAGESSLEVPDFLLSLRKVLVNEEASKDTSRVLYTKDIELKATEGIQIKTGTFTLKSPSVVVSTAQGTYIQNLHFTTNSSVSNQANIQMPVVRIGYVDWRRLLHNKGLYIPAIHIEQPVAAMALGNSTSQDAKQSAMALHEQISQFVPAVKIDSISLNKGNLQLSLTKPSADKEVRVQNFDLVLKDVLIDSAAAQNPKRVFYSGDVILVVHDFIQGGNELYTVKLNYLRASTLQGIYAENLTVQTNREAKINNPKASIYELSVPVVSADFTDWGALTEDKGVYIPSVDIIRPKATIIVMSQSQVKPLHQLISPYVPWLQIGRIEVEKGDIRYVQATKKGNPTFALSNFYLIAKEIKIDSAAAKAKNRFLYTKKITLKINDYALVTKAQQKLNIGYLYASTRTGVSLQKITLRKQATSSASSPDMFYQVSIPSMQINFTQWQALTESKGIRIPMVDIANPQVFIYTTSQPDSTQKQQLYPQKDLLTLHEQITPFIPWMAIDSVRLWKGQIKYVQDKDSTSQQTYQAKDLNLTLADVQIDSAAAQNPDRVFYTQHVQLTIQDSLSFANSTYGMSADSLYASTEEGIASANLLLSPRPHQVSDNRDGQLYEVSIPHFFAAFTDWGNFMQARKIHVPSIKIEKPSVRLIGSSNSGSNADANTADENNEPRPATSGLTSLQNAVTRFVPALTIDSISLDKGSFQYVQQFTQQDSIPDMVNDIFLTFIKVRIDSLADTSNKVLYSEDVQFRVSDYKRVMKDSLYTLAVKKFSGSTAAQTLQLDSLVFTPRYAVKEFFCKAGGQQDILRLEVRRLNAGEINFDQLIHQQDIIAGAVVSDSIVFKIFRDRRVPPKTSPNTLLLDAFRQMDTYVRLDSISLNNSYVAYTEIPSRGDKPGSMFFENITASIRNLTNDSTLLTLENPVFIKAQAQLMGEGKTNITLRVPLFHDTRTFQYTASIGQMDLKALNPVLENIAFIRIRSGKLDELTASVEANHDVAKGIMCAFYKNFEVELLSPEQSEVDDTWKDVATFMANKFVLGNANRRKAYTFNPGIINMDRPQKKSTINYFWSTFRSGIYGSIGYKKAKKWLPFL
ncbi:hypothetical protein Q0590_30745 [Rhodocytophaga aerolata]|uniref:DUF748 domain-containing protein n=1 Tax=Rhodocytophaga aerolata TaxID=455078 RepID=A0ABT8RF06_9BACT|nr:hypothetical protein [Rhodocytophaga aerolata]MDO1450692.1 hypothetical protein [Rhodocytophaga aerolata]